MYFLLPRNLFKVGGSILLEKEIILFFGIFLFNIVCVGNRLYMQGYIIIKGESKERI